MFLVPPRTPGIAMTELPKVGNNAMPSGATVYGVADLSADLPDLPDVTTANPAWYDDCDVSSVQDVASGDGPDQDLGFFDDPTI